MSALSALALGALAVQIILGALTVWLKLAWWTVAAHLGMGMLVLGAMVVMAWEWRGVPRPPKAPPAPPQPPSHVIDARTVSVPVMGRIAAGTPISAIQNHTHDIACPPDLLTNGEHFALEVKGDSMIEAGIHDGDTVIIRRCDNAENGDIVVALVEKEEATLKRLRKKGSTIALEAANPEFKTRIFGPDQIDIQGRLVGLMRRY